MKLLETNLDRDWKGNPPVANLNIQKNRFGVVNRMFTLVPEVEYQPDMQEVFVLYNCQIQDPSRYIFRNDYSDRFNLRVVYALRQSEVKRLNKHFEAPTLVHQVTAFLDSLRLLTFDSRIHAMILEGQLMVALTKGDELQLVNLYPALSTTDIIYFLSLLCQRFDLNPHTVSIDMSGFIQFEGERHKTLNTFFGNIRFPQLQMGNEVPLNHWCQAIYSVQKCA